MDVFQQKLDEDEYAGAAGVVPCGLSYSWTFCHFEPEELKLGNVLDSNFDGDDSDR